MKYKQDIIKLIIFLILLNQYQIVFCEDSLNISLYTDQKAYVVGEKIWMNGAVQNNDSDKYLLVELLDRNGIQKSYVYLNLINKRFSGFIKIPTDIKSDYYFLHSTSSEIEKKEKIIPLIIINPLQAPDTCNYQMNKIETNISNLENIKLIGLKNEYTTSSKIKLDLDSDQEIKEMSIFVRRNDYLSEFADSVFKSIEPKVIYKNQQNINQSKQSVKIKITSAIDGNPIANIKVWASILGNKSRISYGTSSEKGEINFLFPIIYGQSKIVFSADTTFKQQINMDIVEENIPFISIQFPCLSINERMKEDIENRLLSTQLQDKFYLDSTNMIIDNINDTTEFYGNAKIIYLLDNYVRFPDLREIFTEIIPEIRIKNGLSNNPVFQILNQADKKYFENNALLLLDGVPIYNYKEILNFDALKIKSIEIVDRIFYLGKESFNGIIHFKTYTNNLSGFTLPERDIIYPFNGVQLTSYPIFDNASPGVNEKLPDFRNLLYREIFYSDTGIKNKKIEFSTKNATGSYQIEILILTSKGNIIQKIDHFNVKSIQ